MYQVYALVSNFDSPTERLIFDGFTLRKVVESNLETFRQLFKSTEVDTGNWIYGKEYQVLPPGPPNAPEGVGGIPVDTEDILFLLRLYKVGDVSFYEQRILRPDGTLFAQIPHRTMNDLNIRSAFTTEITLEECLLFMKFADGLRASQSWRAPWFSVARRFFLYGSGKEYVPQWDEFDRIVDYTTALEATLVPETEFSKNRCSLRAAKIVTDDLDKQEEVAAIVKKLYDVRSAIVHGSVLSANQKEWLIDNCFNIELYVRRVLANGVQAIPPDEEARASFLSTLYDVADTKRGDEAFNRFCAIRTDEVRQDTGRKISRRITRNL
jgi:hypothetical protein